MTGLLRKATLITAVGLMAASAALASVPSAGTSTVGTSINLGGTTGGAVDILALKTITVRDAANNPVPNSVVIINFSVCTAGDIRLCSVQPGLTLGQSVSCGAKTITGATNASGVVSFTIAGGAANGGGNPPGVGAGCASVTADGVPLGSLTVGCPDENSINGVDATDTANYFGDRFGAYRGRSDLNGDGVVDVLDTARYFQFRFGGGSTASCGVNC